jgi:hypothetical protein
MCSGYGEGCGAHRRIAHPAGDAEERDTRSNEVKYIGKFKELFYSSGDYKGSFFG